MTMERQSFGARMSRLNVLTGKKTLLRVILFEKLPNFFSTFNLTSADRECNDRFFITLGFFSPDVQSNTGFLLGGAP